ncbi:hypothetical protein BH23CHL5_BH23CHL5_22810 [soil metagenome]
MNNDDVAAFGQVDAKSQLPEFSAAILAGGRSSRMGQPKAQIRMLRDGPTILDRTSRIIGHVTRNPFIVSHDISDYPDATLPVIADSYRGTGPLGGILTALENANAQAVIVVGCDMPFLSAAALRFMTTIALPYDILVPVQSQPGRQGGTITYQTLHAIYRKSCIDPIKDQLARGDRKIANLFRALTVSEIDEDAFEPYSPDLLTFMSIDTPGDLASARELAAKRSDQ